MIALGYLAQATIGNSTGIAGFAIAPTGPASLNFTIGPGSIHINETIDATAYSTLGTDSGTVFKQGLLTSPVTLTITPPSTSGYSQVYLVQIGYQDSDTGSSVLPYFNSSNPLVPWNGPSGLGSAQTTLRQGLAVVQLKAGTAAPTGSQVTPSVDAGFIGAYAITVANGATTITSANWVQLSVGGVSYGAPWFPNLESLAADFVPVIPATTYYVNFSTGSDSNTGLTPSAAFATLQHAIDYASGFFCPGIVTINVAAGTYNVPAHANGFSISASLIANWKIVGAGAGSTIINCGNNSGARGFVAYGGVQVSISGMTFQASYYESVAAQTGSQITISNCNFIGGTSGSNNAIASYYGALVNVYGSFTFSGNWAYLLSAGPGIIQIAYHDVNVTYSTTFTMSGSMTISGCFAAASSGGVIVVVAGYATVSGTTPTGSKYYVSSNAVINATSLGTGFFPGSVAGTTASGGQYLP